MRTGLAGQQLLVDCVIGFVEHAERNLDGQIVPSQKFFHRRDRDPGRLFFRVAVNAGAYIGKGDAFQACFGSQPQAFAVAGGQQFTLAARAVPVDGPDGMDDMFCGKPVSGGDFRPAGFAAASAALSRRQLSACAALPAFDAGWLPIG